MGVTVEQEADLDGRAARWDVHEHDPLTFKFEVEGERPFQGIVAITAHHPQGPPWAFQPAEQRRSRDISEMPDLVRIGDLSDHVLGKPPMGIGEHRDLHFA